MEQRFLADDEINDAKEMIGWQFWASPIMFGVVSVGLVGGALASGDPVIIFLSALFVSLAVALWIVRLRDYNRVVHDLEVRIVAVIEGAPEKVWIPRSVIELTKLGFCYLRLSGRTIRVSNDCYGELREANMVKVAFLPTALVAVRVEPVRGIGRL